MKVIPLRIMSTQNLNGLIKVDNDMTDFNKIVACTGFFKGGVAIYRVNRAANPPLTILAVLTIIFQRFVTGHFNTIF